MGGHPRAHPGRAPLPTRGQGVGSGNALFVRLGRSINFRDEFGGANLVEQHAIFAHDSARSPREMVADLVAGGTVGIRRVP